MTDLVLTGSVRDAAGRPLPELTVRVLVVGLREERPLADAATDAEGAWMVVVPDTDPAREGRAEPRVRVVVLDAVGTELAASEVRSGGAPEPIDVVVPGDEPASEFERVMADLEPGLEGVAVAALTEADLDVLRERVALAPAQLRDVVDAARRAEHRGAGREPVEPLPAEVFYAWRHQGLDADSTAMWRRPVDELVSALATAVEDRVVPAWVGEQLDDLRGRIEEHRIEAALERPAGDAPGASLRAVLATLPDPLDPPAERAVATVLDGEAPDPDGLPARLRSAGLTPDQAGGVARTLRLAELTGNQAPLVAALQPLAGDGDDPTVRGLVAVPADVVLDLAYRHGAGANGTDPIAATRRLRADVERLHPSETLAARLEDGTVRFALPGGERLAPFLRENPGFDAAITPIEPYLGELPPNRRPDGPELADALHTARRLRALGGTWDRAAALAERGMRSALDVLARDGAQLADALEGRVSASGAAEIHARAATQQAAGVALMGELPRLSPTPVAAMRTPVPGAGALARHPTLQALFGAQDTCACGHCRSVLSPSAYLVDLLELLRRGSPTAWATLLARRPDLGSVELSCANTEIEVPAIDLVLEALERAAALPLTIELGPGGSLAGAKLPEPVLAALGRTALDVPTGLRAVREPDADQRPGLTRWSVADGARRWLLEQTQEQLTVRPSGRPSAPPPEVPLAGLDLAAEVAGLDQGLVGPGLDERLRPFLSTDPRTAAGARLQSVVGVEPGRRWQVSYLVGLQVIVLGAGDTGTITLRAAGGTVVAERTYSAPAIAATSAALGGGEAGGMLTALLPTAFAFAVEGDGAGGAWTLTQRPVVLEVRYTAARLTLRALTLQSTGDAAERAAVPQHQLPAAYDSLTDAPFPWSLPFDLPLEETRALLARAGVPLGALMALWVAPTGPTNTTVALESLGLSPAQAHRIETPLAPEEVLWRAWGAEPAGGVTTVYDAAAGEFRSGAPLDVMATVSVVLQQARISHAELLDLLATGFVRRAGVTPRSVPETECRPSELRLEPVNPPLYERLHRFVRLWRALGWSIAEVDAALGAFGEDGDVGPALYRIADVVRLHGRLGVAVAELVSWWAGIGTTAHRSGGEGSDARSQYQRLFGGLGGGVRPDPDLAPDPAGGRLLIEAARASADLPRLRDKLGTVAAAFRTRVADLELLLDALPLRPGETRPLPLTLDTLSRLHRAVGLARALGLTADDYPRAIRVTGIEPFPVEPAGANRVPERAAAFAAALADVRDSGFTLRELAYLLRDERPAGLGAVLRDSRIAGILASLRVAMRAAGAELEDGGVEPLAALRAALGGLGWPPSLVARLVADLGGEVAVTITADAELLERLVAVADIGGPLAGSVAIDGSRLVAREMLPAAAWSLADPVGLYHAVPRDAPVEVQDAWRGAVGALRAASEALQARLARRLRSVALPQLRAETPRLPAGFIVPGNLRDRVRVEATPDGAGHRILATGWVDGDDAAALRAVLPAAHHAAVDALVTASDAAAQAAMGTRLLTEAEIADLARPPRLETARLPAVAALPPVDRVRRVLAAVVRHLRVAAAADALGQAAGLDGETAHALLADLLRAPGTSEPAMAAFLAPGVANGDPSVPLPPDAVPGLYAVVRRVHKIALLASRLALGREQLAALAGSGPLPAARGTGLLGVDLDAIPAAAGDADETPPAAAAPVPFAALAQTVALARLRRRGREIAATVDAYTAAALAPGVPAAQRQAAALAILARALELPAEVVTTAAERTFAFGLRFDDPLGLSALLDLLTALRRLGIRPADVPVLTDMAAPPADRPRRVAIARAALRSRFPGGAWAEVVKPVSDALRARRRDALVDHLVHTRQLSGPDALSAQLLVDVLTEPCLGTTRILDAIAAVQRFVHRCLLNLEPAVPAGSISRRRWEWMKTYRVWEANRKVFLWPQNWLHPELREDASEAFRGVESALGQSEAAAATAHDALLGYLDDLVRLSHLNVQGLYRSYSSVYVVARTPDAPYQYFWRACERMGQAGMRWRPWERVDVDIAGTHVLPFVLHGDLHLAWPVFRKTLVDAPGEWEVKLAWARRSSRGWTDKKLSRQVLTAPALPNVDERRTFTFSVGYEQIAAAQASPALVEATATKAGMRVMCWAARDIDPRIARPRGSFHSADVAQAPPQLDVWCRVLRKAPGLELHWAAPGVTVSMNWDLSNLSSIPPLPFGNLPVTNAYGESTQTVSLAGWLPQFFESEFVLRVPGSPAEARSGVTIARRSWYPELLVEAAPDDPVLRALTDPERELAYADLGSFLITAEDEAIASAPVGRSVPQLLTGAPYDNGVRERAGATTDVFEFNPFNPARVQRTPGRFEAVQDAGGGNAWYYRDDLNRFYLLLGWGHWTVFADGHVLAEHLRDLARGDLRRLYAPATQALSDGGRFLLEAGGLQPPPAAGSGTVQGVTFDTRHPYGLYNWELFLHVPMLIAAQLSRQQRFEEAQTWLRLVFDPESDEARSAPAFDPRLFWRFAPFRAAARPERIEQLLEWLADPAVGATDKQELVDAIERWRDEPFRPHEIARTRTGAYQWDVLFAYLDNLLDWGDERFRRDTRESLVEAGLLYVQAAALLGPRPRQVEPQAQPAPLSYLTLSGRWDTFANAWLKLTDTPFLQGLAAQGNGADAEAVASLSGVGMTYFCVPHNERLTAYWDRVEDRLFKLRHCQNIEGIERELPLFEPPIDPDLLVRAVAAGADLDQVVADAAGPVGPYRYTTLAAKAGELCTEVRALGAGVLAALEKGDAERLARLRSGHEVALLDLVEAVRLDQVAEAAASVEALLAARAAAESRYRRVQQLLTGAATAAPAPGTPVVELPPALQPAVPTPAAPEASGLGLVQTEADQLAHLKEAQDAALAAGIYNVIGSVFFLASSTPYTTMLQGAGHAMNAMASLAGALSANAAYQAGREALIGGHQRRRDGWASESNAALRELAQVDAQVAAARVRQAIAEKELTTHRREVADARTVDAFMRDKYTNAQLYAWMSGELGATYFAAHHLALQAARRAERAFRAELAQPGARFIRPQYWDGLRRGLTAGDLLAHDLRRMELAYLEGNRREQELTRVISLHELDPLALLRFRETGACEFEIPETLFDLDAPGQFLRRLKAVGLSIPAVVGRQAAMHPRLTLLASSIRHRADGGRGYAREGRDDVRFTDDGGPPETVVASGAVEATGMWEPMLRDERRLPFEGRGAISAWRVELPSEFRQFDYDTATDVTLTLRYTARDGGEQLRVAAVTALDAAFARNGDRPFAFLVSLRHEFPTEWARLVGRDDAGHREHLAIPRDRFPGFLRRHAITVRRVDAFTAYASGEPPESAPSLAAPGAPPVDVPLAGLDGFGSVRHARSAELEVPVADGGDAATWTVGLPDAIRPGLRDVVLVLGYTAAR